MPESDFVLTEPYNESGARCGSWVACANGINTSRPAKNHVASRASNLFRRALPGERLLEIDGDFADAGKNSADQRLIKQR